MLAPIPAAPSDNSTPFTLAHGTPGEALAFARICIIGAFAKPDSPALPQARTRRSPRHSRCQR